MAFTDNFKSKSLHVPSNEVCYSEDLPQKVPKLLQNVAFTGTGFDASFNKNPNRS